MKARTAAACMDSAIKGLYADALPPMQPSLRQLAERALVARQALNEAPDKAFNDASVTDFEAYADFMAALVDQTGIPTAMWRQLGSILP